MENNKTYLKQLPVISLMAIAISLISSFWLKQTYSEVDKFNTIARTLLPDIFLFVSLGIALNKWKEAMMALALSIVLIFLEAYVLFHKNGNSDRIASDFLIGQIITLLPYISFFVLQKLQGKKLLLIIAALIAYRGIASVYYTTQNAEIFDNWVLSFLKSYKNYIGCLFFACSYIFKLIFYCELQNLADDKAVSWQPRLLNPGNRYDKLSSTIVFYVFKLILLLHAFGTFYMIKGLSFFLRTYERKHFRIYLYNNILSVVLGIGMMVFIAWYLRKSLLEFLISYDVCSKFLYWALLLPGIGFIVWLILLTNDRKDEFIDKKIGINKFASSSSQAVTMIIMILMSLQFIRSFDQDAMGENAALLIMATIVGFALFLWLANQRLGFFVNLYLSFAILLLLLTRILFWTHDDYFFAWGILFSLMLYNVAQLILIYPVYHFDDTIYITEDDLSMIEEKKENSGDILSEFESY